MKKINLLSFMKKKIMAQSDKKLFVRSALTIIAISVLSGSTLTYKSNETQAWLGCVVCSIGCIPGEPILATEAMDLEEDIIWEGVFENNFDDHLDEEQGWIVRSFYNKFWRKAVSELTHYLTAFGMYQVEMVGMFFDAKHNLETQRLFFQLQAEAHKDYQPSDDFCWFGTNARSLAASESRARLNMIALSENGLQRQIGYKGSASGDDTEKDKNVRWNQFITTYCDPKDNGWNDAQTGLDLACDRDGSGGSTATGATDRSRVNRDIDFTALIEEPRTLNFDMTSFSPARALTSDEEDVIAMSNNLYGHQSPTRRFSLQEIKDKEDLAGQSQKHYMDLRSVIAKRTVAQSSYNAIVAMKSSGTNGDTTAPTQPNVGRYMSSIMKELMPTGTPDAEIIKIMGNNPSYYAQLEVLGKKIYQNPEFFANLYDKPANVARKSVAMKAVDLMLDRALFESELRQEMILSVLLSSKLKEKFKSIDVELKK